MNVLKVSIEATQETENSPANGHKFPSDSSVLVVGAGPVGLVTAFQLAKRGIRTILVERNLETTKWPKMDITNVRSMELLDRLGLADDLRKQGVPGDYSLDCLFSTGLSDGGQLIAKWDLESPDEYRERIKKTNDGTMPRQPYQRCSQSIFEAWMKPIVEAEPLVACFFGVKFESLRELDDAVESTLCDSVTDEQYVVSTKYVLGCDGASSRVRRSLGIPLTGGPIPMTNFLVHFRSRDLERLHKQGQFWHIFFCNGGVIISQNEKDIWTVHMPIPPDTNTELLDPYEVVFKVLGGSSGGYKIDIDEILVTSAWIGHICVAEHYRSNPGRVFLAGDAAHQNIPLGGYGMNTGLGDAFDIGWKLAAVINGYGGEELLNSYEIERYPVADRNVHMSGVHGMVHRTYVEWVHGEGQGTVISTDEKGESLRDRIRSHVLTNDGENKCLGVEMGYRNFPSPIVLQGTDDLETPEWNEKYYIPSTSPGARAPHVFLRDGDTSIHDLLGFDYSLVDFTTEGNFASRFKDAASHLGIPIATVHLPNEQHARDLWERDVVLVRPDLHVAWRLNKGVTSLSDDATKDILLTAVGKK